MADFLELAELMCRDALDREESAAATSARSTRPRRARRGATTSTSATSPPGSSTGDGAEPRLHKEQLEFEHVKPSQRSYK